MEKSVQITLIIVAGILLLGVMGYTLITSIIPDYKNTINVNGRAEVKTMPDLVAVYFNIQTNADTAEESRDNNSKIVDDLTTALIKKGFEKKEIQTMSFNIYPNYIWDNGKQKEDGYTATHEIRVEFSTDDSDKIGEVIDAGVDAGAGISYINFELSQELQNQYKAEAIKLASQDARLKAGSLAEGLDKKVGDLVSVSMDSYDYYPWRVYTFAEGASSADVKQEATSIQPSEQDITASVTAVFKIE